MRYGYLASFVIEGQRKICVRHLVTAEVLDMAAGPRCPDGVIIDAVLLVLRLIGLTSPRGIEVVMDNLLRPVIPAERCRQLGIGIGQIAVVGIIGPTLHIKSPDGG